MVDFFLYDTFMIITANTAASVMLKCSFWRCKNEEMKLTDYNILLYSQGRPERCILLAAVHCFRFVLFTTKVFTVQQSTAGSKSEQCGSSQHRETLAVLCSFYASEREGLTSKTDKL